MTITPIRELLASFKIELIPLAMNAAITGYYLYQGNETGKILYWLGACIVTIGLLYMEG